MALEQKCYRCGKTAECMTVFCKPCTESTKRISHIANEICDERQRQDAKWGEQNHPSVTDCHHYQVDDEDYAKEMCELATKVRTLTWGHIACEELAEAINAANDTDRRAELVQLAAVVVAWIECIDRNGRK